MRREEKKNMLAFRLEADNNDNNNDDVCYYDSNSGLDLLCFVGCSISNNNRRGESSCELLETLQEIEIEAHFARLFCHTHKRTTIHEMRSCCRAQAMVALSSSSSAVLELHHTTTTTQRTTTQLHGSLLL